MRGEQAVRVNSLICLLGHKRRTELLYHHNRGATIIWCRTHGMVATISGRLYPQSKVPDPNRLKVHMSIPRYRREMERLNRERRK